MKVLGRAVASVVLVFAASGAQQPPFDDIVVQATAAREANDVSKAMGLYRQALEIKPDWAEGWWFLGTLAYDSDRYADGESAFSQFVKLDGRNPMAWGFLGLCEFETGGYERALDHLRRAFETGSGVEPSIDQVLRFHEVLLLDKLGLFDQAMPKLRPFVRQGLKNNMLLSAVGLTALRRAQLPQEISAKDQPLVSAAGQAAYFWMAGDDGSTAPAFKALLENYPQAPGVHYLYATYLLAFRPAEEAYAELKRELEVNPHSADARATIALLMVRAGGESAALPLARQAAEDGPACPMAQYAYGLILGPAGHFEEAIKRLETAVRLDPSSVEYHMGLARAYSRAGRAEDARRERQVSIQMAREGDANGPR